MTKEKEEFSPFKGEAGQVTRWSREIENAENHEQNYLKEGRKYNAIYRDQTTGGSYSRGRYNIFWANTQTLAPLVFAKLPEMNITRRFLNDDRPARILSEMLERSINYFLEKENAEAEFKKASQDRLVVGRGVARVVMETDIVSTKEENEEGEEVEVENVDSKKVRVEYVNWENILWSPATDWKDVRWVAFRHKKTREELVEQFGEIGKQVTLDMTLLENENKQNSLMEDDLLKVAEVWEIWDKTTRRVKFLTAGLNGKLLSDDEDPYNLEEFFPIPKPLGSDDTTDSLIPIPLYRMYKCQAEELNMIDERIKSLVEQCKATGVYASFMKSQDVESLFNGRDGEYTPLELAGTGANIRDAIFHKPLVDIITTIRQLYEQKTQVINNIRDITGLSDIVRGTSFASETATAQQLKGNFAISRIQPLQRENEVMVRDVIRLFTELISENFSIEELAKLTGLEVIDLEAIEQAARVEANTLIQRALTPQTPEEQLALEQKTPEQREQELAQLEAAANQFVKNSLEGPINKLKGYAVTPDELEGIETIMENDKLRDFSIDIETESTARIDQNQEKQDRLEFTQVVSQFATNIAPLVQTGIIQPVAGREMLSFIMKPFKVGRNLEEYLLAEEEVNPEPEQPSFEEQALVAENNRKDQELQLKAREVDIKQQEVDVKKAQVLSKQQQFEDNLEFEDVNKEADRRAKLATEVVQDATEEVNNLIRQSDLI